MMPFPERVTPQQAALIFRRAAELDAAGALSSEGLTASDLEEVAVEVGLTPESVRVALGELRSGALLRPAPSIGWGSVSASRVVGSTRSNVLESVGDAAERHLLSHRSQLGDVVTWDRRRGAASALSGALMGRRNRPLLGLQQLRALIAEHPDGSMRVGLTGRLSFPVRLVPGPFRLAIATVAGGAALATAVVVPDYGYDLAADGFFLSGATATVLGASSFGLRAYRRRVGAIEAALEDLLDRIERPAAEERSTPSRQVVHDRWPDPSVAQPVR